jgi:four helix bundle protein
VCHAEVVVYRFEDLRVWQAAKLQCDNVARLMKTPEFQGDAALAAQMNRAALSVMNNISEGFLRHHDGEFMNFLRIAAGSNGEVRSCLYAAQGRGYLPDAAASELIEATNVIGRMIRRLQSTLTPTEQSRRRTRDTKDAKDPKDARDPKDPKDPKDAKAQGPRPKD